MGAGNSTLAWEQRLLESSENSWGMQIPNSGKPGFSPVLCNPAVPGDFELGCINNSTGVPFYTLWECMLRGREISGPDSNFLATRRWSLETVADKHTDKSLLPKNYVRSGYIERADGSVLRGDYVWDSYQEVYEMSAAFGRGLTALGCKALDNIGVFSINRAEWIIASLAFYSQKMTTVALYATLGANAIEYIVNHAELPVVVCSLENFDNLVKSMPQLKTLKQVVLIDCIQDGKYGNTLDVVTEQHKAKAAEFGISVIGFSDVLKLGNDEKHVSVPLNCSEKDDIAFLMYTSGTTGDPRGVLLSHLAVTSTIGSVRHFIPANPHIYFSYLPLAHILETVVQVFVWTNGGTVFFSCGDIRRLVDDLQAAQPSLLPGVPRVFLKFYQSVMSQIEKKSCIARMFINRAFSTQMNNLYNMKALDEFFDQKIFSLMRDKIGLNRIQYCLSGGAPCPSYVATFMKCLLGPKGHFMEGYGCTECSAGSCVSDPKDTLVGSIGCPLACNKARLMDLPEMNYLSTHNPPTGELHITGPSLFNGYYKDDAATAAATMIDENGVRWFKTGDVARFNPNGSISIIDRAKQLIKLAQGEYIAIEKLEDQYGQSPLVCQLWCYGNAYKPYVVAVAVPNIMPLYEYLVSKGWWSSNVPAPVPGNLSEAVLSEVKKQCTANYEDLKKWMLASLKQQESGLQGFEKIKAIHFESNLDILGQAFNEANNLLTPTMKKRRRPLTDHYLDVLQQLYVSLGETINEGEKW